MSPRWTCPEWSQTDSSSRRAGAMSTSTPPTPPPTPFKRLPGNISRLKRCIFQHVNKKLHILVLAWVKVTLLLFYEQERRVARQKELLGAGEKINGGFSAGLARRRKAIQDVTCQGCAQDSSPPLSQSFLPSDFHKLPEGSRQLFF